MMDIVFRSDGRLDELTKCLHSFIRNVDLCDDDVRRVLVEDRPSAATRVWQYDHEWYFDELINHERNLGAAASMNTTFSAARDGAWLFMVEGDFLFERRVALEDLHPGEHSVLTMALKRQPIRADEIAAGDILRVGGKINIVDDYGKWTLRPVTERPWNFWTCNPCLMSPQITKLGTIPVSAGYGAEEWYGELIREKFPHCYHGYYGVAGDAPHIKHIGIRR